MKTAKTKQPETKQPEMSTAQFTSLIIMMGWHRRDIKTYNNVYTDPNSDAWIQIKGAINSVSYFVSKDMKVRNFTKRGLIEFISNN